MKLFSIYKFRNPGNACIGAILLFFFLTSIALLSPVKAAVYNKGYTAHGSTVACADPAWNATGIYTKGNRVSYNSKIYEARWWTQGENPEQRSNEWDVWKYIGTCDGNSNSNPSVTITSPAGGVSYNSPAAITINATATDSDGTITIVEFFNGSVKLGEDISSPYTFTWTNVGTGTYALTAKATDNAAGTGTSPVVNVTVTGSNTAPVVSITSPANNAVLTAPAAITINASATDADGTITKVEFFNGGAKLGEDNSSPYSFTWSNVAAGVYSLTVSATDNSGITNTSAAVAITVNGNTGGTCNVPAYVNGAAYNTGDVVKYNNKKYSCEVGGWCSLGGAYEPGIGWAWDNAWELLGDCTGGNNGPSVNITAPANNSTVQLGQAVTITASASDADGTIAGVEFLVDGSKIGEDTSSPYAITWAATQGFHTLIARATDNSGNKTDSSPVSISAGTPDNGELPSRLLSGYWHAWNGGVPFIKLRDVSSKWDVVNISFAEPVSPGSTDGQMKFVLYGATADYIVADFKADIKLLQSQGKKIIISIGGYEGYFSLTTTSARDTFVNGMKAIINEYGFDGIDIDLEQSSLELNAGDADFRNPTSPKVVHMISAIRTLCDHYGSDFILTFAPEAFYLQLGYQWYAGIHSGVDRRAGVYIPVIHALRDKITFVQAQLYNQPSVMALDGKLYSSGTADYLVAMSDMLLKGFNVGGNSNYFFPPLRPDQVLFGVPASAGAAGSGQVTTQQLQQAFNYMVKGTSYGGQYALTTTYPALRGIMTWSINWDAFQNNNSFVNAHRAYLDALGAPASTAAGRTTRAAIAAQGVPSGWGDFQVGLVNDNTNVINVRMKKALGEGVKLNYRYAYVNNGVDPNSNALSWLFNQWGTDYSRNSQEMGLRPAYVIYMLQEEGGAAALKNNIKNADFMRKYFTSIRMVSEKSNGYKAIFVIEPDTWGYFLQDALEKGTQSDPRQIQAVVNNLGAGYEYLSDLPNTMSGVAQAIIRTIRRNAPDAYCGLLMSFWSVNANGATGAPVADGAKGMVYWNQGDVQYSAQRNAVFTNQLLPATGDRGDFIGVEKNGWSAGNWLVKQGRNDYYWNDTQNAKWVSWSKTLSQNTNLPLLGWQISIGHMGLPNTVNRYEDTFMPYFFNHVPDFIDAGFIGFLAGKGLADCTDFTNLNGNTLEADGSKGDDGWFFEKLKTFDNGRPYLNGATGPAVTITSPANNTTINTGSSVTITANASAGTNCTVLKVSFFHGTVQLGEDASAPYSFIWTNIPAGSYSITAKVTTSCGSTAVSPAVSVTAGNQLPVVNITSPANGTTYTAPATITINATASDNGSITKVAFFNGSTKLGEDTASPYSYAWSAVTAGTYNITAVATDNEGATSASPAISITVNNATGGCGNAPQYIENGGYVAGSQVQSVGSLYECRAWPYSGWCNGAAWAYGPGIGTYWQDAWILKGSCAAQLQTTAATPEEAATSMLVYPNPVASGGDNMATLVFDSLPGDVSVQILNADGNCLLRREYDDVQRVLNVEVPPLSKGLYVIRVQGEKKNWVMRYVVR